MSVPDWLTAKAEGIYRFRWVECQMDQLKKCHRVVDVKEKLTFLPRTLNDTYKRILLGIPPDYSTLVARMFTWIIYAKHPLTIQELADAIVLTPGFTEIDPESRILNPEEIVELCASLLKVNRYANSFGAPRRNQQDTYTSFDTLFRTGISVFRLGPL